MHPIQLPYWQFFYDLHNFFFPFLIISLPYAFLIFLVTQSFCFLVGAVAFLLLLAVALLCAYELCAVYVTAGASASERYSPSGFFFGVSAIALAINMLFVCRMVFSGNILIPYAIFLFKETLYLIFSCKLHLF